MKMLLASSNKGKIREMTGLLSGLGVTLLTLDDFPELKLPPEDGATFLENALIKARSAAKVSGVITIADDSGLEADKLDNKPGIMSARYAREGATDEENNLKLLAEMNGVPEKERGAVYKCVIALVDPATKAEATFEGSVRGFITESPKGDGGFGYDPLFYLPEFNKTVAELSPEIKNTLSHRAKALEKLKRFLLDKKSV